LRKENEELKDKMKMIEEFLKKRGIENLEE
jgi:hypothetical protein